MVMLRMSWLDKEGYCPEQESRLGHRSLPFPLSFLLPFQILYILKLFKLSTDDKNSLLRDELGSSENGGDDNEESEPTDTWVKKQQGQALAHYSWA